MKRRSRIVSILLSSIMILSLACPPFVGMPVLAAEENTSSETGEAEREAAVEVEIPDEEAETGNPSENPAETKEEGEEYVEESVEEPDEGIEESIEDEEEELPAAQSQNWSEEAPVISGQEIGTEEEIELYDEDIIEDETEAFEEQRELPIYAKAAAAASAEEQEAEIKSGSIRNLNWTLDEEGVLTITTEGEYTNTVSFYDLEQSGGFAESDENLVTSLVVTGVVRDLHFNKSAALKSVDVRGTVTNEFRFYECPELETVHIAHFAGNILSETFREDSKLVSFVMDKADHLLALSGSNFFHCTALTEISLSQDIIAIGWSEFSGCASLTELPDLTKIEDLRYGRPSLPEGESVADIGLFAGCSSLTEIRFAEDCDFSAMSSFSSSDKDMLGFKGCTSLMSVTLPARFGSEIPKSMFEGCSNLKEIVNIDNEMIKVVNMNAFAGCSSLRELRLADTVTTIYKGALPDGLEHFQVPKSAERWNEAFSNCTELKELRIPSEVTTMYKNAGLHKFSSGGDIGILIYEPREDVPSDLRIVGSGFTIGTLYLPEGMEKLEYSLGSVDHLIMPDTIIEAGGMSGCGDVHLSKNLKVLSKSAFSGNKSITEIDLPDNLESIGDYAFQNCTALSKINLPEGLTSIGTYAFSKCTSLTELTVPGTVEEMGTRCFADTGLMSVVMEEGVTDIPKEAFYYASSLTDISLPESLGGIEYRAFNSTALSSVALNQKELVVKAAAFTDVEQMSFENESLTLEDDAIRGCNHFLFNSDRVVFQAGTTSNTCISLSPGEAEITFLKGDVDLGENGINVGKSNLKIYFGPSVTAISGSLTVASPGSVEIHAPIDSAGQAFAEKNNLKFVDSDGENVNWTDLASGYQYLIEDGHIVITGYTGKEKDLWIPETLFGYPVTEIRDIKGSDGSPRKGKSGITGIDFPASIEKIDPDFTLWSSALKTVSVSGTNKYYKALAGALYDIDTTTLIKVMPEVTSVKIPDTVTEIGEKAFSGNSKISTVTFGNSPGLQSIGEKAFYNCVWLEEMDLPKGLERIGDGAFAKCKSYEINQIPVGVKTIGNEAFSGCEMIRSVDLPDTVATLGKSAFPYAQIECMTFAGPVQIANDEFEATPGMLYVPEKGELYTVLEQTNPGRVRIGLLFEHYLVGLEVYEDYNSPYVPIKKGGFVGHYGVRFTRAIQPDSIMLSIRTIDDQVLVSSNRIHKADDLFKDVVMFGKVEDALGGLPADTEVKMTVSISYEEGDLLRLSGWDSKDVWTRKTLPDMWKTSNVTERIPDYIYEDYFFDTTARILKQKFPNGSDGTCFGMALALQLFRSGEINIADFNADTLWEAQPANSNSQWQMTIKELWQSLQLFQYTNIIGRMGQNNWGDYPGLYKELQDFDDNVETKLVITIKRDLGGGREGDHEIAPLKVLTETDETIDVLCYDPNIPGGIEILSVDRYNNHWSLNGPARGESRSGKTISYVIVRDEWKDYLTNWKSDKLFQMDPERILVYSFKSDYKGNSMPQADLPDREVSAEGTSLFYHDRTDGLLSMHLNLPGALLMMSTDHILMTASFTSGTGTVSMLPAGGEDTASAVEITPDETGRYEVTIEYDDRMKTEGLENGRSIPDMLTLTGETKETVKLADTPKGIELTCADTITLEWDNDGKITEKTWTGLDESSQGSDDGKSRTLIEVDEQNGEVVMVARIDTDGDGTFEKEISSDGMKKSAEDLDITLSKTSFVYTGKVQKPSVIVKDGSKTVASSDYDIVWSGGCVNAGSYKAVITMKGNYTGTTERTFTITKADNSVIASDITRPFSAKAQTFRIGAKTTGGNLTYKSDNANVKVSDDGKVTIAAGTAGKARITITAGDSNYRNVTKTILVTVPKGANTITASDITRSYSAKTQTVSIDSKATGGKLRYSSNNEKVHVDAAGKVTIAAQFSGMAKVTITAGDSNYQTVRKIINVTVPERVKLTSVKNTSAKKIKVKWKKGIEITGYQIQYSLKSNFKSAKKTTIKKATTVSKVLKGLKKGKKYYVRIRTYKTVGGKKYYSSWSAKKKVTIRK